MSGATRGQLFFLVRCLAGLRQILLGVNQTTMAALNMIIVASIIGGSEDIGWRVLSTLRKAEFGESLVAGIVIALMAMVLDRITYGLATRAPDAHGLLRTTHDEQAVAALRDAGEAAQLELLI